MNDLSQQIEVYSEKINQMRQSIKQVIIGQNYLIDRLLIGLLANGHVLLEGVPGLAKTLSVRTLAQAVKADFKRIQFTPDLLPADIVGTLIYNPREGNFTTKKGPIFANIVLADEINRAPAKVQSALLEAMQEKQVTLGDTTFKLPSPFLVLATENPIDQEGTYPLPEAQVDRFMLKLKVGYPSIEEERQILDRMANSNPVMDAMEVITPEAILEMRRLTDAIYIDDKVKDYIVKLIFATRYPDQFKLEMGAYIQFGGSPRATLALTQAARAWAFLQKRTYVTPQDIKTIAYDVLRHRIILSYEAEAEGITVEQLIDKILATVPVP